jgi:hypothetical protein
MGGETMDKRMLEKRFEYWCKKLRITPHWSVKLEFVDSEVFKKTGDIKIDCDDKKAILLLNERNPKGLNLEEVIVHELFHLKLYPMDQVTESLIVSNFNEGTPGYNFAYREFFQSLEQTVAELTKCFLLEFGEKKELSYGRCTGEKSFNELFNDLKNLE